MACASFFALNLLGNGEFQVKDEVDWSLKDAYKIKTMTKEKISLNGVWKISLQTGEGLFAQKKLSQKEKILLNLSEKKEELVPRKTFETEKTWKTIRVPGLWHDAAWWSSTQYESLLGRDKFQKPLIRVCNKVKWNGAPLKDFYFAWYQREFVMPENWKPGEAFLRFGKINREAWIFANSKYLGHQVTNQSRDIPLPKDIQPGNTVRLDILVGAFVSGDEKIFMGGDQIHKQKKASHFRGITGDAWLIKRPAQNFIENVFVIPSVRKKELIVKVEFSGEPKGMLKANIKNWKDGEIVKKIQLNVKDGKKTGKNELEFAVKWNTPTLWNPDNPHLYSLCVTWDSDKGKLIDEYFPVRFGFREMWIEGRQYFLNGSPVRFRIATARAMPKTKARAIFKDLKKLGHNCVEMMAGKAADNCDENEALEAADEEGIMVLFMTPAVNKLTHIWQDDNVKKEWLKKLSSSVNTAKNHPSVVQWAMNFNFLGYPFDLQPYKLGMDYYPPETSASGSNWKVARESEEMLKQIDNSRPIYHHACGNYGQAHTSNMYLCFSPLQEKSEWPSIWAKKGKKPFMAIELGTPCELSYYRNREGVGSRNNFKSEPLYAEYAARLLGASAYGLADTKRLKPILEYKVIPGALGDGSDEYKGMMGYYYVNLRDKSLPDFIKAQAELGEFLKNWRTYGVCGFNSWYNKYALRDSLKPYNGKVARYDSLKTPGQKTLFDYTPGHKAKTLLYDKYQEWLAPSLFYISGPKSEFTDKGHAYWAGAEIKKGIAWVNDTFSGKNAKASINVEDENGKNIFSKTYELKAFPGEIQIQEFSFKAPDVKFKKSYTIKLGIDGALKDEFKIQVFPKLALSKIKSERQIFLMDTKGFTGKKLVELGIPFKKYNGEKLGSKDLLVIGRESLSEALPIAQNIKSSVTQGANLIVFEQQREDLKNVFGLRAFEASARRTFPGKEAHPLLEGISKDDMSNWPGKATLLEGYPEPGKDAYPKQVWKFGNRQIVASSVIEKPHKGSFKSFIHEGFDLGYTPLLEETVGNGKILFCQLDVSGRTEENPAGDIMLHNIVKYMDKSPKPKVPFFYTGGITGQKILDLTGVKYEIAKDVSKLPVPSALVIGGSKSYSQKQLEILTNLEKAPAQSALEKQGKELKVYAQNGGTVIILAANSLKKTAELFSIDMPDARMTEYRFPAQTIKGATSGLGGGDWYWKDNIDIPLPSKDSPVRAVKTGKGQLIICQVNPLYYKTNEMHQRRRRSQAKMTRILSTIFANMGASFKRSSVDRMTEGKGAKDIDLCGKWHFRIDPDEKGLQEGWSKKAWGKGWKPMEVPGSWEDQGENAPNPKVNGKLPYDGCAWYQKSVYISSKYKGKQLYLEMGTVDDFDWTYFNGKLIGKTGKETPKYWAARRYYLISGNSIKYDAENLIAVRVMDNYMGGGITKGPVKITFKKDRRIPYIDANIEDHLRLDPYNFHRW